MVRKNFFQFVLAFFALTLFFSNAFAQEQPPRNPFGANDSEYKDWAPTLVSDSIMPSQTEIMVARREFERAFSGTHSFACKFEDGVELSCAQDYASLTYGATCIGEKFDIGGQKFENGLGTHANSRIFVSAPEQITRFVGKVGLNSNCGGSVQFAIEGRDENGKPREIWRSGTVRGGEPPLDVDVSFQRLSNVFTLVTYTTDDGPNCDQANWLEPTAFTLSGKRYDLAKDGATSRLLSTVLVDENGQPTETYGYKSKIKPIVPFSFTYGGKSSRDFLQDWIFNVHDEPCDEETEKITRFTWIDPETRLTVEATVRFFKRFAACDWFLRFTNNGAENTPIIENVKVLDATFFFGIDINDWTIDTLSGDSCSANSWTPLSKPFKLEEKQTFAPVGGRSSNGAFPFWNITPRATSEDESTDGLFFALGWTGQWNASFERPKEQRSKLIATAGMETFASFLYSDESIRTPRVLVMPWKGNKTNSQVLFRRLLMHEYAPKIDGKPVQLEFISQCFDRYYRKRAGWEKLDAQLELARKLKELGGTCFWFDAAWFPVGFPNGVGNWFSDKDNFPNGVEQLGEELKKLGLKFVLWFEPERVAPDTDIAVNHPQYVFGGEKGGLYKLNDPEARKYLTDLLLKCVNDFQVDVYRNDFNIDPYPYWLAADEPDRKGMTETRYVEGLYEMWDQLRAQKNGLWIDNCASGGRRIDLETLSRSVPLWRSDTCCFPGRSEWAQSQTLGLARYLPLFSACSWEPDPYAFRSAANPGAIMQYDFLNESFDSELARRSIAEAKTYQKFWYGDFYPLTGISPLGNNATVAWQLHRADLDAGVIYAFRQPDSPYALVETKLHGIDPNGYYRVTRKPQGYDVAETMDISGGAMIFYPLVLDLKGTSGVVEYYKIPKSMVKKNPPINRKFPSSIPSSNERLP